MSTLFKSKNLKSPKPSLFFQFTNKVLLITDLPKYDEYADCYTEEEVANLLIPFGFQYLDENIYVSPQMRMVGTRFINALHIQTFDKFSQDSMESFHI